MAKKIGLQEALTVVREAAFPPGVGTPEEMAAAAIKALEPLAKGASPIPAHMTDPTGAGRLGRDLINTVPNMGREEARFLVKTYYQMQENRKRSSNQVRALSTSGEPIGVLAWLEEQAEILEHQIRRALDKYSVSNENGQWLRSVTGIGPVIAAGLMAHIDITKARTSGAIWRFAGLDPTSTWEKGQKRPWNAELKVLCWKAGDSFVKTCNNPNSEYGHHYKERKALETERNERGEFKEQADVMVKKVGKTTVAYQSYKEGKLPAGHLDARARRYAVKLFLSHYFEVAYRNHYGTEPPLPYPIAHMGHAHKIEPKALESANGSERANDTKGTTRGKRANGTKSAGKGKRANAADGTTPTKRAKDSERAARL